MGEKMVTTIVKSEDQVVHIFIKALGKKCRLQCVLEARVYKYLYPQLGGRVLSYNIQGL